MVFNQLFGSGEATTTNNFLNEEQIRRGQRTADSALTAAQDMGPYQGNYYAGLTPDQIQSVGRTRDFVGNNRELGQGMINDGQALQASGMGVGTNAQTLFDQAMGRTPEAARDAAMAEATGPRTQALVDAALRDTERSLNEDQLTSLQQGVTATGNRNSSRAGAMEAIIRRDAGDRMADVSAQIRNDAYNTALSDDYRRQLSNDQLALAGNTQLGSAYDRGMSTINTGLSTEMGLTGAQAAAGGVVQADQQMQIDAERARHNDLRMDGFNILDAYNRGIGGPILESSTTNAGQGAFQRFGSGMQGLQQGIQSIGQIGAMFSGNPAAAMGAAGG
ncbi:MAG: hypothetical protein AAF608_05060 [Pseudomonadota bacterium]